MAQHPFSPEPDGVRLAVRLTPRAGRDALDGVIALPDGRSAVQIRLSAPPVEGAANEALVAFLARVLGLRKNAITIRSGHTSRLKLLHLAGDSDALMARLADWIDTTDTPAS
ncbi:MAG TPA: DUF167 domain-containing protein [Acidisphaera sp.]|nr:DUF167 domain-containing protein [Acidisphaera sp.]